MDSFADIGAVVILTLLALVMFGLARLADGECRSFLTAWAEESGMTILRCRRCWLVPQIDPPPMRVIYWLIAVDRQGWLRSGWASVAVKFTAGEAIARGVEVRWLRVRAIARPVGPTNRSAGNPLWDRWVDQ